jgi:serine/threonine-protein kinase
VSLTSGTRLGAYEILAPIGAGGMGEVYQARDTKLGREVAIKVLPEAFSEDKERLARFEREARLLASLNHPNIATLHGLEESADTHYLVMELVPGETLGERIQRGLIPIDEALPLFTQIAEGLEAAHEKGVIHRDLKPGNIKVTPEGKVKVLDFGLAKAFAEEGAATDLSQSPTMTREATQAGVIMGTAAYMSPEQARGKTVDKRADIWAFGCCLYEALTGRKAFGGETVTDVFAAIVRAEPRWDALPPPTPQSIRRLLPRCLEKDPNRRLHDIADARIELETAPAEPSPGVEGATPKKRLISLALAGLAVGAVIASFVVWNLRPSSPRPMGRLALTVPAGQRPIGHLWSSLAISPDGTHVVYKAREGDKEQLYLRPMDRLEAEPIPGTEGAVSPFFSPDGLWIGFFADGQLKKVSIRGGAPQILCEVAVTDTSVPRWGSNGRIFIGTDAEITQVSSNGGTPELVTAADSEKGEADLLLSDVLPGGKAILFSVWVGGQSWDELSIVVYSLETGERSVLIEGGTNARYVPTGHLVYVRSATLMAVPFDLARLEVTGPPSPSSRTSSTRAIPAWRSSAFRKRDGWFIYAAVFTSRSGRWSG